MSEARHFKCPEYGCSISQDNCLRRFQVAQQFTSESYTRTRMSLCIGCSIGASHERGVPAGEAVREIVMAQPSDDRPVLNSPNYQYRRPVLVRGVIGDGIAE